MKSLPRTSHFDNYARVIISVKPIPPAGRGCSSTIFHPSGRDIGRYGYIAMSPVHAHEMFDRFGRKNMDALKEIFFNVDRYTLLATNHFLNNPLFDRIAIFFNHPGPVATMIISLLLIWILIRGDREVRLIIVFAVIAIIISDGINSHILKEFFHRVRPCRQDIEGLRILVHCGKGASFPSSHAANNFAAALVLSAGFRKLTPWFFIIAFLVSISRVYAGVHFPSDIIAGSLVGLGAGWFSLVLKDFFSSVMNSRRTNYRTRNSDS